MSTLKNSYVVSIGGECEVSKRSKGSNLLWELWTNKHQSELCALKEMENELKSKWKKKEKNMKI